MLTVTVAIDEVREQCQHCGTWVRLGKLGAFADNFRSLKDGHVLLCPICKALWHDARAWLASVSN